MKELILTLGAIFVLLILIAALYNMAASKESPYDKEETD